MSSLAGISPLATPRLKSRPHSLTKVPLQDNPLASKSPAIHLAIPTEILSPIAPAPKMETHFPSG